MNERQKKRDSDATAAAVRRAISLAEARAQVAEVAFYCSTGESDEDEQDLARSLSIVVTGLRIALAAYVAFAVDPLEKLGRDLLGAYSAPGSARRAAYAAAVADLRSCMTVADESLPVADVAVQDEDLRGSHLWQP